MEDLGKTSEGNTNIGYWEQVLKAPTSAYQELFDAEKTYLITHIPNSSKVLDIGCGEGRNMKSILEVTPNVYGVDMDIKAVEDAKENFKDNEGVQVVQGEAKNLPFEDKSFDVVTLLMILPNLNKDKEAAFKEAARVLRDNGFVIISTFAETAFDERMEIYKRLNAPIKKIEGTTVVFDESLGANVSEQFSLEEIENLAQSSGLTIAEHQKVGLIAYICKLVKK